MASQKRPSAPSMDGEVRGGGEGSGGGGEKCSSADAADAAPTASLVACRSSFPAALSVSLRARVALPTSPAS